VIVTREYRANYGLIEWHTVERPITRPERTSNRAPHYISDHMDPTMHMVTGTIVDSKSQFRKMTREAGCEEVGNDMPPRLKESEKVDRPGQDIKRAIEELRGR
jgi:hypothetical protein